MSWWVKEHIAVNEDETKQLCRIEADNQTSLPAADQTATAGFIIVRGSSALVLDTGDRYIMNSGGTWVQQPTGVQLDLTGYATQQEMMDGLAGKQDQLTFDTAPTSGSSNPVTSDGIHTDQQRQEAEIGAVAAQGAMNLFKNTAVSKTYLGVTFTVNEDGTVSLSGTAITAAGVLELGSVTPPAGSYIVSGCPAGGNWSTGTNKYRIRVAKNGSWAGDDIGKGRTITVNGSDTISLQINSGIGVDTTGLVFKPMIRRAEITDDTYVPYAPTNRELYEMILALQSGVSVQSSAASLMQTGRIDAEMTDAGTDEEEEER